MFHYEGTQQLRSILTDHDISHALFYKDPTSYSNEEYLLSFISTIQANKIDQPIILIGHSCGGSYARYISKHLYQIRKIITLDSSYYKEYDHKLSPNDLFVDHNEDECIKHNALEAGELGMKEIAYFYEADPEVKPGEYKITELTPNYYHIYTHEYNHSLHMRPEIAALIIHVLTCNRYHI
jgi:pimeloyl-ACP methyl ester carboxylesterase